MNHFSRFLILALFSVTAFAAMAAEKNDVTFHAKFVANVSELHISIPTDLIVPTLQEHYQHLHNRELSQAEIDLYLEMYLRETVKLQYGAYPMALGESGITHEQGVTELVIDLAGLPKEARALLVQINSFAHNPKQKNVFQITKSIYKQSFALSNANAFTTNVPL